MRIQAAFAAPLDRVTDASRPGVRTRQAFFCLSRSLSWFDNLRYSEERAVPQNRSTHVQERPGRAAAPCLRPPSSLAAPRRVAFMPATMSSFLFVFKSKSFVAMYREGHFGHIVSTAQDGLLEDRKHTDRVGYRTNDLAKQWTRGQSVELLAPEPCASPTLSRSGVSTTRYIPVPPSEE